MTSIRLRAVTERPEGTARGQDTPNYVTESSFPEMIGGRTNVGDVQSRRLLAVLNLKANKHMWADASAFAGIERKAKPADADVPRLLNWGSPEPSDDGAFAIVNVRSLDNKDRWLVKIDNATGKASIVDHLHDDAWIRESGVASAARAAARGCRTTSGSCSSPRSPATCTSTSLDVSTGAPAKPLTSGNWEVTSAQLSADRGSFFLTTNEVHPGERHFYTMPAGGGTRTRVTTTGASDVTVSPDEKSLAVVYSLHDQTAGTVRDAVPDRCDADAGDDDAVGRMAELQVDRSEGDHLQVARR